MSQTPEMSNVFQFRELRPAFTPDVKSLRQNYIQDDLVDAPKDIPSRLDADLQSARSPSAIGRLVYEFVFCEPGFFPPQQNYLSPAIQESIALAAFMQSVLGLLTPYQPLCADKDPPDTGGKVVKPLSIFELERSAYIYSNNLYYLMPERLEQIEGLQLLPQLQQALEVMERVQKKFDLNFLVKKLVTIFNGQNLREVVFQNGIYTPAFRDTKRILFDTLYFLYIMRKVVQVNFEHVIQGLRVLHVIEALAVDEALVALKNPSLSRSDALLEKTLEILLPAILDWDGKNFLPDLPLIQTEADYNAYFSATPVVHPVFARLRRYKYPFNDLKPIGIGDLKVVKQWLTAYLPGEISYVENVLKGETRSRTHRRLEKTEESFSFSSSGKESFQKDTQTTDRFELKSEVENIIKSEMAAGVNTAINSTYTYPGGLFTISGNVGANFSYKRDTSDQSKISNTFGREVVTKAIEQVEKNVAETRSVTQLFETEETNIHSFINTGGQNTSGLYRWLDKQYKAQLFNYGKRMMFEFMIPEPAAFFVEARLRSFEANLDLPQPPVLSLLPAPELGFTAESIGEAEFQLYQRLYDLTEFTYPELHKEISFLNPTTGENYFEKKDFPNDNWLATTYNCKLNAKNYQLTQLTIDGNTEYQGKSNDGFEGNPGYPYQQNTMVILIDGTEIIRSVNNTALYWTFTPRIFPNSNEPQFNVPAFTSDDVNLTIGLWDGSYYRWTIRGKLVFSEEAYKSWQREVFNKIFYFEQQRVAKINQEKQLAFNSQMATYRNRIGELKATSVNDLLQGQSEAFNRKFIGTELKRHCLTMLTREFDADETDDLIGKINTIQANPDAFNYQKFKVTEDLATGTVEGAFELQHPIISYPAINLDRAKAKGRYIQFLEQAFEWEQLSYVFYSYFWANRPKWIDMMNRTDETDPNMSAFLQAGSAKILVAVTTAYENAVLHFLATREPWEGGPAPVIGDPLFIPLYEELRKQQDDLYHAIPEGEPWTFVLPTSLVYLDDSGTTLPTFPDIPV